MRLKNFPAVLLLLLISISSARASDYYTEPSFSPYSAGTLKYEVLNEALQELNYIRNIAGLPSNVTLNDEYTRRAQHGAVLLDAIDTLTHHPGRPSDMTEAFYSLGYDGAEHGNISVGKRYVNGTVFGNMSLIQSIQNCMDDSDAHNISSLGHRRWLMNPRLKRVGFGLSTRRGYAVTYLIEEFGKSGTLSQREYQEYLRWKRWPINDEFITWPSSKNHHPLRYFDSETAWSVTLNDDVFDRCNDASVSVKLTRARDGRVWNFSATRSDGYFRISHESYAYDECIIFRPVNAEYRNGELWLVEVSGLSRKKGGTGRISYRVNFTD